MLDRATLRQFKDIERKLLVLQALTQPSADDAVEAQQRQPPSTQEIGVRLLPITTLMRAILEQHSGPRPQRNKAEHTTINPFKIKDTLVQFIFKHGGVNRASFPCLARGDIASVTKCQFQNLFGASEAMKGHIKADLAEAYDTCSLAHRRMRITTWHSICTVYHGADTEVTSARDALDAEYVALKAHIAARDPPHKDPPLRKRKRTNKLAQGDEFLGQPTVLRVRTARSRADESRDTFHDNLPSSDEQEMTDDDASSAGPAHDDDWA